MILILRWIQGFMKSLIIMLPNCTLLKQKIRYFPTKFCVYYHSHLPVSSCGTAVTSGLYSGSFWCLASPCCSLPCSAIFVLPAWMKSFMQSLDRTPGLSCCLPYLLAPTPCRGLCIWSPPLSVWRSGVVQVLAGDGCLFMQHRHVGGLLCVSHSVTLCVTHSAELWVNRLASVYGGGGSKDECANTHNLCCSCLWFIKPIPWHRAA